MLELRTMEREEMYDYLDGIKKGILTHPNIPTQNIQDMVDDFLKKTENDSKFILYYYRGDFYGLKDNVVNIKTSEVSLGVLRFAQNGGDDILMMGYLAQIVECDHIIYADYGGNEYIIEILTPQKHIPV